MLTAHRWRLLRSTPRINMRGQQVASRGTAPAQFARQVVLCWRRPDHCPLGSAGGCQTPSLLLRSSCCLLALPCSVTRLLPWPCRQQPGQHLWQPLPPGRLIVPRPWEHPGGVVAPRSLPPPGCCHQGIHALLVGAIVSIQAFCAVVKVESVVRGRCGGGPVCQPAHHQAVPWDPVGGQAPRASKHLGVKGCMQQEGVVRAGAVVMGVVVVVRLEGPHTHMTCCSTRAARGDRTSVPCMCWAWWTQQQGAPPLPTTHPPVGDV